MQTILRQDLCTGNTFWFYELFKTKLCMYWQIKLFLKKSRDYFVSGLVCKCVRKISRNEYMWTKFVAFATQMFQHNKVGQFFHPIRQQIFPQHFHRPPSYKYIERTTNSEQFSATDLTWSYSYPQYQKGKKMALVVSVKRNTGKLTNKIFRRRAICAFFNPTKARPSL